MILKTLSSLCIFQRNSETWMPTLRQLETYNNIRFPEPSTLFSNQKDLAPASRYQLNEIGNDLNLTSDLFMGSIVKPNLYDSKTLMFIKKTLLE